MALVRVNKSSLGNTSALSTYTTASFALTGDELVIVFFNHSVSSGTAGVHTINATGTTLTGITWTAINSAQWNASSVDRFTAWWGQASVPTTGVLAIACAGTTGAGAVASVFAYTGHDIGGPVSAEVAISEGQAITGPVDVSALTGDLTVWGCVKNSNAADGSHSGATTIHTPNHAAPTRLLMTLEEAGENAPDVTWGTTYTARLVAFKIRELKFPFGVYPASLDVAVTFGTPTLAFGSVGGITVTPAAFTVPVSLGAPTLILTGATLLPVALPVAVSFGVPTLAFVGITVTPSALSVAVSLGIPTLASRVTATALSISVGFGAPTVATRITTTALSIPVSFGAPTLVIATAGTVTPSGLAVAVAFGTPTAVFVGATVTPAALTIPVTFGVARVSNRITTTAFTVPVSFGSPTVAIRLAPATLTVPTTFGTARVSGQITTTALSVTVTLGAPTLLLTGATLTPPSFTVTVSFGNTVISIPGAPLTIAVNALVTAVTVGTPTLSFVAGITVTPASLTRTINFGTPSVRSVITVPSLATFTAFGAPTLAFPITVVPSALSVPITFGTPTLIAGTAAQTLTPQTDIGTDFWTTDTGSTTGLAAALADISEANFIQSEDDPVDSPYVVALTDAFDPGVGTGHIVSWSHRNPGPGDIDLTVELRQGYVDESSRGGLVGQWTEAAIPSTFTTVTKTLSVGEANTITDYTDLFLRFEANASTWEPSALSGLVVWLDAADYSPGLWSNRGSDSDPIVVGTPSMAVSATTLNGLPVVRFKANEGRVRGGWSHPIYDFTVIYVTRWVGPGVGRNFSVQYPPSNLLIGSHTSSPDTAYDNGTWLGAGVNWSDWSPGPGPWRIYCGASADTLGFRFYIDGAIVGSPTGGTGGFTNGWGLSGYDATGTPETLDFEVAELVIYNRRLSDAERLEVEAYLTEKWGL